MSRVAMESTIHAAVKTAVEKEQRRGREAIPEVFHGVAKKMGIFLFLPHPPLRREVAGTHVFDSRSKNHADPACFSPSLSA